MKYLVVGLGNPGRKYKKTKHNAGSLILDELASERGLKWKSEKKFKAEACSFKEVVFLKPLTFMNLSGEPVLKAANFYKINPENIIVIHDDVDFNFLEWKLQFEKDSAGHKGVKDVINRLGTNKFWRLRFGIGRPKAEEFEVERYVLSSFSKQEIKDIKNEAKLIIGQLEDKVFSS